MSPEPLNEHKIIVPEGLPPQMESTPDRGSKESGETGKSGKKRRTCYLQFDYAARRNSLLRKALCYIANLEH
jgi:hypothetical protein